MYQYGKRTIDGRWYWDNFTKFKYFLNLSSTTGFEITYLQYVLAGWAVDGSDAHNCARTYNHTFRKVHQQRYSALQMIEVNIGRYSLNFKMDAQRLREAFDLYTLQQVRVKFIPLDAEKSPLRDILHIVLVYKRKVYAMGRANIQ